MVGDSIFIQYLLYSLVVAATLDGEQIWEDFMPSPLAATCLCLWADRIWLGPPTCCPHADCIASYCSRVAARLTTYLYLLRTPATFACCSDIASASRTAYTHLPRDLAHSTGPQQHAAPLITDAHPLPPHLRFAFSYRHTGLKHTRVVAVLTTTTYHTFTSTPTNHSAVSYLWFRRYLKHYFRHSAGDGLPTPVWTL